METQKQWMSRYTVLCIPLFLFFSYFYLQPSILVNVVIVNDTTNKPESLMVKYLVDTPTCKIPNLDPWNEEVVKFYVKEKYIPCSKNTLLTYVQKNATHAIVKINQTAAQQYTKNHIKCCYKWIERSANSRVPDDNITISKKCIDFSEKVVINNKTVMVTCRDRKQLYSNVHVAVTVAEDQYVNILKVKKPTNNIKPISVLIIGIDSVSRLNFYRTMPSTLKFLQKNGWIEYQGYNKIGENTYPNLMAILTGKNPDYTYSTCDPTVPGKLETCPFVWTDFKKFGYVTAYAEDEDHISTFNYKKKGFVKQPTDYYFKPYMHGAGKLKVKIVDDMTYCTGPEQSGERILNLAKDFSTTFLGHPTFGLFWMNSFSHNKINSPTRMDEKVRKFFEDLEESGVFNEVMAIFISDHGMRFGDIRKTTSGWSEERLPYLYFWVPPWLRQKRPKQYNNLRDNANHLTSPYDMYMTIQDILVLSNLTYTPIQSDACPLCQSLFTKIDNPRSCEETGIDTHWCTCNGYVPVKGNNEVVKQSANLTLKWIETEIQTLAPGIKKCAKYRLDKIIRASLSASKINSNENTTSMHVMLMFETQPKAVFETTVTLSLNNNNNTKESNVQYVSRLDKYKPHSGCVEDSRLKNYCYCKKP